ncbi:MAG TPA: tetraacyldisaccharide 4'-kinase, partial [Noviherbaspirillum sp.]
TRAWARRGLLAWALLPLSLIFFLLSTLRRGLYRLGWLRVQRLPVPVIVVGNVFVGGTGKTPFTIWLLGALRALGYVPGVVSRGYGGAGGDPLIVLADSDPAQVGDEPLLIARRSGAPVVVGRARADAGHALLKAHPEVNVIVADDGLQHYALARDVEVVLQDERGNGNGWVLPAGPLREPASRQRDFTVINAAALPAGAAQPAFQMTLAARDVYRLSDPAHPQPLVSVAAGASRIAAAAGIGNPGRFFGMLSACGVRVDEEIPLPDHYDFSINPFAQTQAGLILITEKDAVKCAQLESFINDPRLWVVPVSAEIDMALAHRIVEKIRGSPPA